MSMQQYALGALKDIKDPRDFKFKAIFKELPQLPASVDHAKKMPPIRNQYQRGACVAFAAVAVKEYQENKEIGKRSDIELSEEFVYKQIRHLGGGAWPRSAVQLFVDRGVCTEASLKYDPKRTDEDDDAETPWDKSKFRPAFKEALKYKAKNYVRLETWYDIQQSLVVNGPCLIGVTWYDKWYNPKGATHTDKLPIIEKKEGESVGGHAICLVGYITLNDKIYFKIRNSWGDAWGYKGYAYISSDCLGVYDAWAIFDVKNPVVKQDALAAAIEKKDK